MIRDGSIELIKMEDVSASNESRSLQHPPHAGWTRIDRVIKRNGSGTFTQILLGRVSGTLVHEGQQQLPIENPPARQSLGGLVRFDRVRLLAEDGQVVPGTPEIPVIADIAQEVPDGGYGEIYSFTPLGSPAELDLELPHLPANQDRLPL